MRIYERDASTEQLLVTPLTRDKIRPEAALESILHANPELILDEPLLITGRQVRLDAGVVDLIALDQFGNVVVIEVKIGRSGTGSASEETILSQPQAYASSLSKFDYDALDDRYQEYASKLDDGEWAVDGKSAPGGTLRSAVESTLGTELKEHEFNIEQRLVIVAEEITRQTAANARYLLEQGVHFQCTEVQRFASSRGPEGDRQVLSSALVVDYDQSRVRPKQRSSPTYPELVAPIVEKVFPSIRGTVHAETVADVFPDGFDTRGPELRSQHPDHPGGVVYTIAAKPDQGKLLLTIDNLENDPEVVDRIQTNGDAFTAEGFTVKDNERYRLVEKEWRVESTGDVRGRSGEIGEAFATLVRVGHDVVLESANVDT